MPRKTWQKLMWDAVSRNEIEAVQHLLNEDRVKTEIPTLKVWRNEEAPLHLAAYCGYNDILALLLNHGADIDSFNVYSDGYKVTCIHFAVYRNKVGTVKFLMEHGADPALVGKWGSTRGDAFDFARQRGLRSLITILRSSTPDDDSSDNGFKPEVVDELDQITQGKVMELREKRSKLQSELKKLEKDLAQLTTNVKGSEVNLECSVCLTVPQKNILTCRKCDVLLCHACQDQVKVCPGCRSNFDEDLPHRNRWAEKLVNILHGKLD
ncbi:putative ankyrin repeat protein RF_0580 [Tigriopus californicus]|nr:putative ankyrin repeat protein RF_0580 [Tigriopus californicus]